MIFSKKYKFFLFISAFVFVINLLIMNEYSTIFNGAESNFLLDVQALLGIGSTTSEAKALLPIWVDSLMYDSLGFNEFGLRLPNVIILILTFLSFYFFGKKIFGEKTAAVALLVMASSFIPVNFAKMATGDTWLFGAQLMNFVMMILFLKQPVGKWKWGVWITIVLGAMVHPISMFVWSLGLWGYLQVIHPKGKNLKGLLLLPLLLVIYLPLYFFGYINLEMPHFLMGIGSGNFKYYFVITLLGILPWFGFLPASLWDMIQKLRKKEELAIINLGWILFSIFSQGMIIIAALSFIISKNLLAYFQKNYPYKRWVKGFTLLNMIFTFIFLFGALLGGFLEFKGVGYRSIFGVSSLYWMGSMAAVLGLFMMSNSLVTGGMAISGLMATWLFWLQVNPLFDSQRDFPKQVYQTLRKDGVGQNNSSIKPTEIYHLDSDSIFYQKNIKVYFQDLNLQTVPFDSIKMVKIGSKDQKAWAVTPKMFFDQLPSNHTFKNNRKLEVNGGKGFLEKTEEYYLIEF